MSALVFFLIGVPVGFLAERLIRSLSNIGDLEYEDAGIVRRRLPWQTPEWAPRISWGAAALVPGAFILAARTFDTLEALVAAGVLTALLICIATDLLSYRVPNAVTYPAIVLTLAAGLVLPDADILSALAAALLAGGIFLVFYLVAPRGGFGLGDVKLAVLIGAALGLPAAYHALLAGMVGAGVVIVPLLVVGAVSRQQAIPYAPFLALAAGLILLIEGAAFAPL